MSEQENRRPLPEFSTDSARWGMGQTEARRKEHTGRERNSFNSFKYLKREQLRTFHDGSNLSDGTVWIVTGHTKKFSSRINGNTRANTSRETAEKKV